MFGILKLIIAVITKAALGWSLTRYSWSASVFIILRYWSYLRMILLRFYGCTKYTIIEAKEGYSYDIFNNIIRLKRCVEEYEKDAIISLHEVGHCVIRNRSNIARRILFVMQVAVVFYRVIIIPMYILSIILSIVMERRELIFSYHNCEQIVFYIFVTISILKLTFSTANEALSSMYAFRYIHNYERENISEQKAKIMYITGVLNQLLYTILIVVLISGVRYILFQNL